MTRRRRRARSAVLAFAIGALIVATACSGAVQPADLSPGEACAYCRMTVSNPRLAAQLVGPGEEPRFFDDIGCLAGALRREPRPDLTAFVADHRTGAWVPARSAVYTRVERLETPMASHLIAHADEASRRADPDAANGVPVTYADVFGASEDGRDR